VSIITLLTDFGAIDPYVGTMKGVMLSINPDLAIVDMSHEVEAQAVKEGIFLIEEYYRFFPPGTVHLCVIDPTVGGTRKPILVTKGDQSFVGPDNGLFSMVLGGDAIVHEISNPRFMLTNVSGTFHGRDIFAPAAAHVTLGVAPSEFGPLVDEPVRLDDLHPSVEGDVMTGEIIHIDRFGNAVSNIHMRDFSTFLAGGAFRAEVAALSFDTLSTSYYERRHTFLVGSSGYLEFGLYLGNLSKTESIGRGEKVRVTRLGSAGG
jgi:S-adenosylmethionine hydrolase